MTQKSPPTYRDQFLAARRAPVPGSNDKLQTTVIAIVIFTICLVASAIAIIHSTPDYQSAISAEQWPPGSI